MAPGGYIGGESPRQPKAGYIGEQPVRVARAESYPGIWSSSGQYVERKANVWTLSPVRKIERSLRFNPGDSPHLSRNFGTAGNRKTWTWAGWVKRTLDSEYAIFSGGVTSAGTRIWINSHKITLHDSQLGVNVSTEALFRDPAAWFHLVVTYDSTEATTSSRVRFYVNGEQSPHVVSSTFPPFNGELELNDGSTHNIGREAARASYYFGGYLADIHFIDGQALDHTSFGEFDYNGVWQPKEYTGTYGANGFHLDFADNSTSAAIGTDTSGNGNDWTVNNIEVGGGTVYATGSTWDTSTATAPLAYKDEVATSPYVIDITGDYNITHPTFAYTGSLDNMFDGTDSDAYLVNDYVNRSTHSFLVDLRDFPTVTSVSVRGYALNGSGYTPYKAELLDSSKTLIPGSTITLAQVMSDNTVPVSGSPRYLKIFRSGGSSDRGYIAGFNINGTRLVNTSLFENNDSLADTPTNYGEDTGLGGEVRGNYCTWNPLAYSSTLSNGNLYVSGGQARGTQNIFDYQCYWEITSIGGYTDAGVQRADGNANTITIAPGKTYGFRTGSRSVQYINITDNGSWTNWLTSANVGLTEPYFPYVSGGAGATSILNAGQRLFVSSAPSGYKALCTANLPEPTIVDGSTAMDVKLYTGTNATLDITGIEFSPDLVWIKSRSNSSEHLLYDTVRGASKYLKSNSNAPETTATAGYGLTAFNSDGFTLGQNNDGENGLSATYAAWCWDAGSSTVTNNDGSVTSQVRANPSAGFSVATLTTPTSGGAFTVGHGLNASPAMVIVKALTTAIWYTYHKSVGPYQYIVLNSTVVSSNSGFWGSQDPSSTVVYGDTGSWLTDRNYVMYSFAPVEGYSAFGIYTGNGSADGPFIYTGFRPRWIMFKQVHGTTNWTIIDSARNTYNYLESYLEPNTVNAESNGGASDFLSNGWKIRSTSSAFNAAGGIYIYAAFAENPFKYARAR